MREAKRRLTIYPGQISMVFNLGHSEEFHKILKEILPIILDSEKRKTVERFLDKMENAITTGKNLNLRQSAIARGRC